MAVNLFVQLQWEHYLGKDWIQVIEQYVFGLHFVRPVMLCLTFRKKKVRMVPDFPIACPSSFHASPNRRMLPSFFAFPPPPARVYKTVGTGPVTGPVPVWADIKPV